MIYTFTGGLADGQTTDLPKNGGSKCLWVRFDPDRKGFWFDPAPNHGGSPYVLKGEYRYILVGFDAFEKTEKLLRDIDDCRWGTSC